MHSKPIDGQDETAEPVCPACGYDLRSIQSERCPECGLPVDLSILPVSRLPWAHRRTIGRFRAFWATTLLVFFNTDRLADEIARPVSLADARRFALTTSLVASIPVVAWTICVTLIELKDDIASWLEVTIIASLALAIWLALFMIAGVASYFFHPGSISLTRQNRAIALSYYTTAPLAWLWLPAALLGLFFWMTQQPWSMHGNGYRLLVAVGIPTFTLPPVMIVASWMRTVKLMRRTAQAGFGRTLALIGYLPVAWLTCVGVALLLPAALVYGSLVIFSFR